MLRVVFTGTHFVCSCTFMEREIPKGAGFHWNGESKTWYSQSVGAAFKLKEFLDASAKREISRVMLKITDSSFSPPFPKHLIPIPFQLLAAQFALNRNKSYLGLDPGLGKTIVAALIANTLTTKTVIVCPPFLTRNTEAEFKKWSTWSPKIVRLDTKEAPIDRPDILIVPDSIVHRESVQKEIFDLTGGNSSALLITDEAHRYKTENAVRTKAVLRELQRLFARQVYLSGTPMPNRPIELHPILSHVAPETISFMDRVQYGLRYCAGHYKEEECPKCFGRAGKNCRYCGGKGKFEQGYDFSGASNLKELQRNVIGPFMLRLRKKDVLKSLPPKTEELVIVGDLPPKLIKMESKILAKHSPEDLMADKVSSDHVATYRRELGKLKVKPALDFIRSILEESEESLLVFAYHTEVIAKLAEGLKQFKPLVVVGKTPNEERHQIVQMFQDKTSGRRLFIGNYLAAGTGLTLTKATRVIMVEYSWVPAENDQASDRAHRIGQLDNVFVQYLIYENSIDKTMMETNFRKRKITSYI